MSLKTLKNYMVRYTNELGSYALGTIFGGTGVGLSIYSAFSKSNEELLLGLFLTGASVPIVIHGVRLGRVRRNLYQNYSRQIETEGFSRHLIMQCYQDELLRNVVEEIAEKRDIIADYKSAISRYLRAMGIGNW